MRLTCAFVCLGALHLVSCLSQVDLTPFHNDKQVKETSENNAVHVTVTFLDYDGTKTKLTCVLGHTAADIADPPPREGWSFLGWYTKDGTDSSDETDWGDQFTIDTVVNEDMTVYARWLDVTGLGVFAAHPFIELAYDVNDKGNPITLNSYNTTDKINIIPIYIGDKLVVSVTNVSLFQSFEWSCNGTILSIGSSLAIESVGAVINTAAVKTYVIFLIARLKDTGDPRSAPFVVKVAAGP